jgi:fructose transport system permease protein
VNATQPATEPNTPKGAVLSRLGQVLRYPSFGPTIALLAVCVFFTLKTENFGTGDNISLIFQQTIVVGVLGIGQTLIILTAGIDLACGAIMAFGTIVMTKLVVVNGLNPWWAIFLGVLACVGIGLANGVLVTAVRLPSFIVTLGTLGIATALTTIYSGSETFSDLPRELTFFGETFELGGTDITYGTLVMIGMFAVAWFVLTHTAAGRRTYALGDNPEAVRLSGVRTSRLLISIYAVAGLCYGIAGYLLVGRTGVGDPSAGIATENLDSITAVVIGGTSLFGGRGSIIGTLIGALIVSVFRNGLILLGVESSYQVLVTGILVILAVTADQLVRRRTRT